MTRVTYRRQLFQPVINLGLVIAGALFIYGTLKILTQTEGPITVVLSESMAPAFTRGDILFLYDDDTPVTVGEIVVYKLEGRDIPIVHRVLQTHQTNDGEMLIVTKGDNNPGDDRPIYYDADPSLHFLNRKHIIGRVKGYYPFIGYASIIFNEYPIVKYLLLAFLGMLSLLNRE